MLSVLRSTLIESVLNYFLGLIVNYGCITSVANTQSMDVIKT